jgi:nitrite reductase (NADH) small subunit
MDETSQDVFACSVAELKVAGKYIVNHDDEEIVVFWNQGEIRVINNICIHKKRKLSQGFILQNRVVCPGHQWAFNLDSGFCRERDRTQQIYQSRIEDEKVIIEFIKSSSTDISSDTESN